MTDRTPLTAGFPALDRDAWEALVRRSSADGSLERLTSRTRDGIELLPIYFRGDGLPATAASLPGAPPFVRGATAAGAVRHGWDVRTVRAEPSPEGCNLALLDDLAGGATSLELRVAAAGTVGPGGLRLTRLDDLERALDGVYLDAVALGLDAGVAFAPAAAVLVALLRRRGPEAKVHRVDFGADPLGALARCGELPQGLPRALAELVELATGPAADLPGATAARADGSPYHEAGAPDALELACVLATAVAYLRALEAAGLEVERALGQIAWSVSLDADLFAGIAKLRAARCLWARVAEECGVANITASPRLQARASRRMLSTHDPMGNLLRISAAAFAAAAGGADTVVTPAFDELGEAPPSGLGRRLARNTQLVLAEEAHLHRVIDAAGGSWYVEHLTEALCERAWERFRALEHGGGLAAALAGGTLASELATAAAARERDIATRRETLVGVNRFATVTAGPAAPATDEGAGEVLPAASAQTFAQLVDNFLHGFLASATAAPPTPAAATRVAPLARRRPVHGFERLRALADRWRREHGSPPRVFLAELGASSEHAARADWTRDLLAAGGFATAGCDGAIEVAIEAEALAAAYRDSGAPVAVLCASDERYAAAGERAARTLRSAGARRVVLAGRLRGEVDLERRLRDAGVDELAYEGCDALVVLGALWAAFGDASAEADR